MQRKGQQVLLACPVSQEPYELFGPSQPMQLPQCGHTIARSSLEDVLAGDATCPVCKSEGSRDITTYRRNISITSLLEAVEGSTSAGQRLLLPSSAVTVDLAGEIGRGEYGTVYRGTLQSFGVRENVAVKVMRTRTQSADLTQHAARQFRLMCRVGEAISGHVVGVRGFVMDSSSVRLVLELAESSLQTALQQAPAGCIPCLSPQRWVQVAITVAEAVAALHELGIIHRAVTPSNVLLSRTGGYKLADCALAHFCASSPGFTALPGSGGNYAYIAPEQYKRKLQTTEKADVWSLAGVLFHAWTGELPFDSAAAPEIVDMHNERRVPELDSPRFRMPDCVKSVLRGCFQYDALQRPSAAALCAQLRAAQDELKVLPGYSSVPRSASPAQPLAAAAADPAPDAAGCSTAAAAPPAQTASGAAVAAAGGSANEQSGPGPVGTLELNVRPSASSTEMVAVPTGYLEYLENAVYSYAPHLIPTTITVEQQTTAFQKLQAAHATPLPLPPALRAVAVASQRAQVLPVAVRESSGSATPARPGATTAQAPSTPAPAGSSSQPPHGPAVSANATAPSRHPQAEHCSQKENVGAGPQQHRQGPAIVVFVRYRLANGTQECLDFRVRTHQMLKVLFDKVHEVLKAPARSLKFLDNEGMVFSESYTFAQYAIHDSAVFDAAAQ